MAVVQVALAVSGICEAVMADSCFLPSLADAMDLVDAASAVSGAEAGTDATGAEAVVQADKPYYHYTSDAGAAGIQAGGQIVPGRAGTTWISPTQYGDAATAQAGLALPTTPTGYFEIPGSSIPDVSEPSVVEPRYGQPGGGFECTTTCRINVQGLPFNRF